MMTQRGTQTAYFKSLNRPMLILGIDRSLFFLLVGLCLPIAFSGHLGPLMDIIAGLFFMLCYFASLTITRADPQMLNLYRRYLRYSSYYAAQPSVHAKPVMQQVSVPISPRKQSVI